MNPEKGILKKIYFGLFADRAAFANTPSLNFGVA
jgi:hypothetical protein